jgi:hypothetical protein
MGLEVLAGKAIYRYSLNHPSLQAVALHGDHTVGEACSPVEQRVRNMNLTALEQEVLHLR